MVWVVCFVWRIKEFYDKFNFLETIIEDYLIKRNFIYYLIYSSSCMKTVFTNIVFSFVQFGRVNNIFFYILKMNFKHKRKSFYSLSVLI